MARGKNGVIRTAKVNPDIDDQARAGDGHGLVRSALLAGDESEIARVGTSPIAISLVGGIYTQYFDMGAPAPSPVGGLSSVMPTDWFFFEAGSSANGTYGINNGSSNTGNTYSYGHDGSGDRALGGLLSGSLTPTFGASFTNSTGGTLNSLLISYVGEQWRLGATGRNDRLDFEISVNGGATWTAVNQLDFIAPLSTGAVGALNGNTNSVAISFNITGLAIANGSSFQIRWLDFDASGSDDGLAIDNFSLVTQSLAIGDVTAAEGDSGTTAFTFTVTRSGGTAGSVGATWTLALSGTANAADFNPSSQSGLVSFATGETSKTITVFVQGDTAIEGNETFTVVLSAPTAGVFIADATGDGTITNDDTAAQNPVIANLDDDVASWSGDGAVLLDFGGDLMVTDADSANFEGGALIVSISANGVAGEDVLSVQNNVGTVELSGGNVIVNGQIIGTATGGTNGNALIISFINSLATPAAVQILMRALTYNNTNAVDPSTAQREIHYQLSGPMGSTTADSLVNLTVSPGELSIDDVTQNEGQAGTTNFTFTVTRAGGDFGAVGASWFVAQSSATASDFTVFPQTGTVSFADGQTSATITVTVQGDTNHEGDENFTVQLHDPTGGATITDPQGFGFITNDDPVITGTENNDALVGTAGDDAIYGLGGHDRLIGNAGNDTIDGGEGDDYISGGTSTGGGPGNDVIHGGDGYDRAGYFMFLGGVGVTVDLNIVGVAQNTGQGLDTLSGIENLSGTSFADVLTGDGGDNWLWGATANHLSGMTLFTSSTNNDTISGNGGNNRLSGGAGDDNLFGGNGDDTLSGGAAGDLLAGEAGDDDLSGDAGVDALDGGTQVDMCAVGADGGSTAGCEAFPLG